MFVHSADKLAEKRTKFHVIQAKLIMSIWCMVLHCALLTAPGDSVLHWLPVPGAGWLPRPQHGAARPRHQPVQGVRQAEQGDTGGSRAGNEVSQCPEKDPRAFSLLKAMKALSQIRHYAEHGK